MTVRPAVPADLAAIMALETAAFTGGWSERSWADEVRNHHVLVADDDRVVGVVALSAVAGTAEVLRVIVDESVRCTGYARALLRHGLAWAETVAGQVFLEVSASNLAAIRLYESEGFQLLDRRADYYGVGDDALIYRLDHGHVARLDGQGHVVPSRSIHHQAGLDAASQKQCDPRPSTAPEEQTCQSR